MGRSSGTLMVTCGGSHGNEIAHDPWRFLYDSSFSFNYERKKEFQESSAPKNLHHQGHGTI